MAKTTFSIYERLSEKTALSYYSNYLIYRYNFSKVVAESLYKDAQYFQLLFGNVNRKDGQIIYYAVHRNEPAGKALKDCQYVKIRLTLLNETDNNIRKAKGVTGLRRHKLKRITDEAELQKAPLTQEDCAHILNTTRRTIIRDITFLNKQGIEIITRSHFTDQGRGITHKERIIKLFLQGITLTEISDKAKHNISNVQKYVSDFLRISLLYREGKEAIMIMRLVKVSKNLTEEYIKLYNTLLLDATYHDPLEHQLSFYSSQLNLMVPKKKKKEIV